MYELVAKIKNCVANNVCKYTLRQKFYGQNPLHLGLTKTMLWIHVTSAAKPQLCQKCEKGWLIRKIERAGATQNVVWTLQCSAFIVSTLRVTVSGATVGCIQEVLFPSIKETGLWHKESAFGLDDAVSGKWWYICPLLWLYHTFVASAEPMHCVFTFYHVSYCVGSTYSLRLSCIQGKQEIFCVVLYQNEFTQYY